MCVHEWSFTRHVHLLFKVQVDGVTMDLEFRNACKYGNSIEKWFHVHHIFTIQTQICLYKIYSIENILMLNDNGIGVADTDI